MHDSAVPCSASAVENYKLEGCVAAATAGSDEMEVLVDRNL